MGLVLPDLNQYFGVHNVSLFAKSFLFPCSQFLHLPGFGSVELTLVPICECKCTSQLVYDMKCIPVHRIQLSLPFRVQITHFAMVKALLFVGPVTVLGK